MKYAVVYKATGEIYRVFEQKGEALHCVTDSFVTLAEIVEVKEDV